MDAFTPILTTSLRRAAQQGEEKDGRTNLYELTPLGIELIEERQQWEADKLREAGIDLD